MYHLSLAILKVLTIAFGSYLVYLAFKAYRRAKAHSMLYTALGFGLTTTGSALAGVAYDLLGLELLQASVLESALMVSGLAALIFAIRTTD